MNLDRCGLWLGRLLHRLEFRQDFVGHVCELIWNAKGWLVLTQIRCVPIIQTMTENDSFCCFILIIYDNNSLKSMNAADISFFLIASGGIISLLRPWTSFVDCHWDCCECRLIGALNGELSCVSLLTFESELAGELTWHESPIMGCCCHVKFAPIPIGVVLIAPCILG